MASVPNPLNMTAVLVAAQMYQAMMSHQLARPPGPLPPGNYFTSAYSPLTPLTPSTPTTQEPVPARMDQGPSRQSPESSFEDKEKRPVLQYPVNNRLPTPPEPEEEPCGDEKEYASDHEDEKNFTSMSEEQLVEQLRRMAKHMKKTILRRFKRDKRSTHRGRRPLKGDYKCTFQGCNFRALKYPLFQRHVGTHYPDAYFCPACGSSFSCLEQFDKHFQSQSTPKGQDDPCVASEEATLYEIARDKERFNMYYMGAMEDYLMPDEHFEILAGRKRGAAI